MKKRYFQAFLLAITIIILCTSTASGFLNLCQSFIKEPMFGMPAFWLRGDNNTVIVKIDPLLMGQGVTLDNSTLIDITLKKSNGHFLPEIKLNLKSVAQNGAYYILNTSIPKEVPIDLFDLEILIETNQGTFTDSQPHAVKVIDQTKENFSIIHLTDTHVDDIRGLIANPGEAIGYKVIEKAIAAINLIDPEFVITTGDFIFGMSYSYEYLHLYRVLQKFDVPIFMSIGNHDAINHVWWLGKEHIDGMEVFENLFAPLNFSFNYGGLKYISLNSMDWTEFERLGIAILNFNWEGQIREDQLNWFEDQLEITDADLTMVGYHHPPESFSGDGADSVKSLARKYNVDAVLNGHTHYDGVISDQQVLYMTTGSLMFDFMSDIHPVFRLIRIKDNNISTHSFDNASLSVPVYKDSFTADYQWQLNTAALFCTYAPSNTGISKTVTATITNHLLENYTGVSLEFVMPIPSEGKTYEVTGGVKVETYTSGDYQIWYVKTDIGAVLETVVMIQEKDIN